MSLLNTRKVVLHTHLEGSVAPELLTLLSRKNRFPLSFDPTQARFEEMITPGDWTTFRSIFGQVCACFCDAEDFSRAIQTYGRKLAQENVVYAEVQFSPWKHLQRGVPLEAMAEGLLDGLQALEGEGRIAVRMICDFIRKEEEPVDAILDWVTALPRRYFVAVGLSGGSQSAPRARYASAFGRARAEGFGVTVHAGEIEGPETIAEAVDVLGASRIGHGITAADQPAMLDRVVGERIHLEICPSANRVIGPCRADYGRIRTLIARGANFSANPDDELIFGTDLSAELDLLVREGMLQRSAVPALQRNALRHAFADEATKRVALRRLELGPEHLVASA